MKLNKNGYEMFPTNLILSYAFCVFMEDSGLAKQREIYYILKIVNF